MLFVSRNECSKCNALDDVASNTCQALRYGMHSSAAQVHMSGGSGSGLNMTSPRWDQISNARHVIHLVVNPRLLF